MQRVITQLIKSVGMATTVALVRKWGGRTFRVPSKAREGDPLAIALGLAEAQRLVEHFRDERLQLPAERLMLLDMRNEQIWRACKADGRSQESVGVEFGLTRQGVAAVLRKVEEQRERQAARQVVAGCTAEQAVAESGA
jgi:Mor family transcriptional regulator